MKRFFQISMFSLLAVLSSCVSEFMPKTTRDTNLLVVEGLITNKPEAYTVKISRSLPLGSTTSSRPLSGCSVNITDDHGGSFDFTESTPGIYVSDPSVFQGMIGYFYTLHINSGSVNNNLIYSSYPMEMRPVPDIDSLYYEKVTLAGGTGAQVYLSTNDPLNECKYYRWEYVETWEFHLPYMVPNAICWVSNNSDVINIKNTSSLAENKIEKYPINLITNASDRLAQKYSILVNQYSMNEAENSYWEKVQNISQQVGGLYDMIPAAIPSNIYCVTNTSENVLGYFSVSAESSKRLFIKDHFENVYTPYTDNACIADTIWGMGPIRDLGHFVWVIVSHPMPPPSYQVITRTKSCYDCTLRGTNIRPDFWQ